MQLTEGKAMKVGGILSRGGKPFDTTLQINAEKKKHRVYFQ